MKFCKFQGLFETKWGFFRHCMGLLETVNIGFYGAFESLLSQVAPIYSQFQCYNISWGYLRIWSCFLFNLCLTLEK